MTNGWLLFMPSELHLPSVPIVHARIFKEKQNVLFQTRTILRHRAKYGFEIGRIATVGHQIQPAPTPLNKAGSLTFHAVSVAG
jgi:hypothetical protein